LWVDSANAAHNISETQNHADHRIHKRIAYRTSFPASGIRLFQVITVIHRKATSAKLLYERAVIIAIDQRPANALILKREGSMSEPTYEELKAKLSQLEKEVETKKRSGDLIFKVGEKGGVSVYGLGRFPVTLYYEQWNRLLGAATDIKAFLEENKSKLKLKDQG
jgi:hypothetical protein